MNYSVLITIVLVAIALMAIVTGIKLIRGTWTIPSDKKEKLTIGAIMVSFLAGILGLIFINNPKWLQRLRKPRVA